MLPALLAGGASLVGGWLANRAKRKEAVKDRAFQERMSSTSWQRGKADMEAAGINPALAYAKGGASTPGGAMAGQENITEGAVNSALQAKRLKEDVKLIKQRINTEWATAENQKAMARMHQTSGFRNIQLEKNDLVQNEVLRLQLPWMRHSAAAINKFPAAAMMQLILNSGGSQAIGLTGLGAAGKMLTRNKRIGR